jgi:hypothetical protein
MVTPLISAVSFVSSTLRAPPNEAVVPLFTARFVSERKEPFEPGPWTVSKIDPVTPVPSTTV